MTEQNPELLGGRYELRKQIARGGMADVYLGHDTLLARPVAVKILFQEHAANPTFVERFRREATASAGLNHPNIVGIYDWGETNGTYYIAMELVEGESLADILRNRGSLSPDQAAEVLIAVAGALGFAHRHGVIHRDVKPGNVLISPSGQVKVADFGIATAAAGGVRANLTQTGAIMGTATYFSPEQAQGHPVTHSSDLYSLGVLLYELLTGEPPFVGDSSVAVAYKHVQEEPAPMAQRGRPVPEVLEAITLKLLAKNPQDRYPSAEDLQRDLRRYREGRHRLADDSSVPVANVEPVTGLTWFVRIVVVAAVLGLVIFGLVTVLGGDDGEDPDAVAEPTAEPTGDEPRPVTLVVPNVVGQNRLAAVAELEGEGFTLREVTEFNETLPPDVVIRQTPAASELADEGSEVVLVVSRGAEQFTVPDVVGERLPDAEQFLRQAELRGEIETVSEENDAPRGEVLAQDPAAGDSAARADVIRLTISAGPSPVSIPDVAELPLSRARDFLDLAGFRVIEDSEPSEEVEEGLVVRTIPAVGELLQPGEEVIVVLSAGLPPVVVPNFTGLLPTDAESLIVELQLVANTPFFDCAAPNEDVALVGRVMQQSPPAGTEVRVGDQVELCLGGRPEALNPEPPPTETPPEDSNQ